MLPRVLFVCFSFFSHFICDFVKFKKICENCVFIYVHKCSSKCVCCFFLRSHSFLFSPDLRHYIVLPAYMYLHAWICERSLFIFISRLNLI